jgi:hypothetical protein
MLHYDFLNVLEGPYGVFMRLAMQGKIGLRGQIAAYFHGVFRLRYARLSTCASLKMTRVGKFQRAVKAVLATK